MFEVQIAAGIAELDQRLPGWREVLAESTLDMGDPYRCVLGQIGAAKDWGSFGSSARHLGFADDDGVLDSDLLIEFGFLVLNGETYDILTEEWRAALTG